MAEWLAPLGIQFPTSGSSLIKVYVRHFRNNGGFTGLQNDINAYFEQLSGTGLTENRPVFLGCDFQVVAKGEDQDNLDYFAQLRYAMIGDDTFDPTA